MQIFHYSSLQILYSWNFSSPFISLYTLTHYNTIIITNFLTELILITILFIISNMNQNWLTSSKITSRDSYNWQIHHYIQIFSVSQLHPIQITVNYLPSQIKIDQYNQFTQLYPILNWLWQSISSFSYTNTVSYTSHLYLDNYKEYISHLHS